MSDSRDRAAAALSLGVARVVLGLAGLHLGIAVAMGPFFVDQVCLLALVVPWGRLYARAVDRTPLVAVVDPRDAPSVRLLGLLAAVDAAGRLRVVVRERPATGDAEGASVGVTGDREPTAPRPLELRVAGRTVRGDAARRALRRRFRTPRRLGGSTARAGDAPSR